MLHPAQRDDDCLSSALSANLPEERRICVRVCDGQSALSVKLPGRGSATQPKLHVSKALRMLSRKFENEGTL